MIRKKTRKNTASQISGILRAKDSNAVKKALILKIERADFDIAGAVKYALERSLTDGLDVGLGNSILSVIRKQVHHSIQSIMGSPEMMEILKNAIVKSNK